jgi:Family of unknown function (DUF5577)
MSVFQMGIDCMGDIISILRHAKTVTDQAVRDNIMAEDSRTKSVAKIAPARPQSRPQAPAPKTVSLSRPSVTGKTKHLKDHSNSSSNKTMKLAAVKPTARRVLPEHEGKYKVSLPKGSTQKTREILAKHSAMQSDKIKKKSIFERLNRQDEEMMDEDDSSNEPIVKSSASIFNRLGNYDELTKHEKRTRANSGILKNAVVKRNIFVCCQKLTFFYF